MGLHTGEVELLGADIGGFGVHVAARVLEHAASGELFASAVPMLVAALVSSSTIAASTHSKGVLGEWRLTAVKG